MVNVFILLIGCTLLAYAYKSGLVEIPNTDSKSIQINKYEIPLSSKIFFIVLLLILVIFAGTRNEMNDTLVYGSNFNNLKFNSIFDIKDWSLGANPLFVAYQTIIKNHITQYSSAFFLITSSLVVTSYMLFIKKHSTNFGFSIYIFLGFTVYAFTMAAMKQTLAVAVGVWAFPAWLKGKKIRFVVLIIIAMFIHPYVFLYFVMIFLTEDIWDKRSVIIIVLTILSGLFFTRFIGSATEFATMIGDEYSDDLLGGTINIFRVLVYLVTPIISFIYRDNLKKQNSKFINLLVNLSLIAASFTIIGSFGAANLMGRLANYFDIFICIALPLIIDKGVAEEQNKKTLTLIAFAGFAVFYYSYYVRYADIAEERYFTDFYNHRNLFDIFARW